MNNQKMKPEFSDWQDAQEAVRCWVKEHRGEKIPQVLRDLLERTQTAYEAQTNARADLRGNG